MLVHEGLVCADDISEQAPFAGGAAALVVDELIADDRHQGLARLDGEVPFQRQGCDFLAVPALDVGPEPL